MAAHRLPATTSASVAVRGEDQKGSDDKGEERASSSSRKLRLMAAASRKGIRANLALLSDKHKHEHEHAHKHAQVGRAACGRTFPPMA